MNDAEPLDSRLTTCFHKDRPFGFAPDFSDRDAWERRASFLRLQAAVALGLWPMPPRPPIVPVIRDPIERAGYVVEKIHFASLPGHSVTGNLYRPTDNATSPRPAVLCPYGHWPDGRFWWRSDERVAQEIAAGAERRECGARAPLQARCATLARMGCVVLHYDMVGYCDSNGISHGQGFLDANAVMRCQSFMGLQAWNSLRALDLIASLPGVDSTRIAVTGGSSGATQAIALAAIDDRRRLSVSFPVVMVSMNMQGGCVCENAPLYRVQTNNVELALLMAPRPLGMAAADDWTHDFESRGLPEMKRIYRLFGAEDRIVGRHFAFPHNYNVHSRELMYEFMNQHLRLGWPSPVREPAFEPIPPGQLMVFDAEHQRPLDETDANGVRAWMTRTSESVLNELAENDPARHADVVRKALTAIIADEPPSAGDAECVAPCDPLPLAGGHWRGAIRRRGTGESIPASAWFPVDWGGDILIWAHPAGCAGVEAESRHVNALLGRGRAILDIDLFGSGHFPATPLDQRVPPPSSPNPRYAGYWLGYNRGVLAERARDVLTAIALATAWDGTRSIRVLATGPAGPGALIALALAGKAVDRAAIDLAGFDFANITRDDDPMLLPGALKYGGMSGIASIVHAKSLICGIQRPIHGADVESMSKSPSVDELLAWLAT